MSHMAEQCRRKSSGQEGLKLEVKAWIKGSHLVAILMMKRKKKGEKMRWGAREGELSAMNILLTPGNTGQEY